MLPTLPPAGCINATVSGPPVREENGIANRNRHLELTREISALIQPRITTGNIETGSGIQGDVELIDIETNAKSRVGVVPHPNTIGFPTLAMGQRQEHPVDEIFDAIPQGKVDITIAKGPNELCTYFVFQTLNVVALIAGDVIRQPINGQTQPIVRCIANLNEPTNI